MNGARNRNMSGNEHISVPVIRIVLNHSSRANASTKKKRKQRDKLRSTARRGIAFQNGHVHYLYFAMWSIFVYILFFQLYFIRLNRVVMCSPPVLPISS